MMDCDRTARSRAVMRCSGCGQPVAFMKVLPVSPSSRARSFISSAKASSLPDRPSATTMQASLPDCTMMPRIRSSTRTCEFTSTNIFEPPIRQAFSETGSSSSSDRRPSFSRSNTMCAVMILLMEAGGMETSASFSSRTVPVAASIRMASRALVSSAAAGRADNRTRARRRTMPRARGVAGVAAVWTSVWGAVRIRVMAPRKLDVVPDSYQSMTGPDQDAARSLSGQSTTTRASR